MTQEEPRWVSRLVVEAIHLDQVREHGGLIGIRDENVLESAVARPKQRWAYEPESDPARLVAAYAYGICAGHPFRDGNKRVAFVTAVTFLELNGVEYSAAEDEVVATMLSLAAGDLDEEELAAWIRSCSQASPG